MSQSAIATKDTSLGRERITDGLWTHRGRLSVGPQDPFPVGQVNAAFHGQVALSSQPPPINNASYGQGQLQLSSLSPAPVIIGFQEQGYDALALYKAAGASDRLRVRGNNGVDYELAGAVGSVQKALGGYATPTSFGLSAGAWAESPIRVTATFGGQPVRVEYGFSLAATTKGHRLFWSLMLDGLLVNDTYPLGAADVPDVNYVIACAGTFYVQPTAGSHRVGVALFASAAGAQVFNAILSTLFLTEQRA